MPSVPVRDINIYYEEHGSGEPLVMIPGLSSDLQAWALQAPALSRHFRVITLDNRGAGRTSAPDKPYSISGMADDVAGFMDHLGIARAHVLGFSMGGFIAQELALKHAAKVNKLILLATAPYIDGYTENVVKSWISLRRSNLSREQVQRITAAWLYSADLFDDRERFEQAIAKGAANPYAQQDHAFIRQAQAVLAFDARDRAAKITCETLLVSGEEDILIPPRNSDRLAKLLPKAKRVSLPGGHVGCIEHPAEYNAAFLEFLGAAVPA